MIVRALSGHAEFAEAVRLQKEIWGFPDLELLPVRFFVVASRVGGQTLGAFDGSRMAGFLLAIPGIKKDTGMPYLHSHMLGVLSDYRNAGVGRVLKAAQREDALARGIRLIEWSFDPFEAKNALFQYGGAGRDRADLRSQHVRQLTPARCTAICPRTGVSPSGGSLIKGPPTGLMTSLKLPFAFPCPLKKPANRRSRWLASCSGILPMD